MENVKKYQKEKALIFKLTFIESNYAFEMRIVSNFENRAMPLIEFALLVKEFEINVEIRKM